MIELTHERPDDAEGIESLLDRAFGQDRLRKTSYQFRVSTPPVPDLSFVVRDADLLIGTIRYWPVSVGTGKQALLLGPIAVDPARSAQGVGGALMRHSLAAAAAAGHGAVLLVGDIAYYGRFGFHHAAPQGITMPGEQAERLLLQELAPGALRGVEGPLAPCGSQQTIHPDQWLPALSEAGRWINDRLDLGGDLETRLAPALG